MENGELSTATQSDDYSQGVSKNITHSESRNSSGPLTAQEDDAEKGDTLVTDEVVIIQHNVDVYVDKILWNLKFRSKELEREYQVIREESWIFFVTRIVVLLGGCFLGVFQPAIVNRDWDRRMFWLMRISWLFTLISFLLVILMIIRRIILLNCTSFKSMRKSTLDLLTLLQFLTLCMYFMATDSHLTFDYAYNGRIDEYTIGKHPTFMVLYAPLVRICFYRKIWLFGVLLVFLAFYHTAFAYFGLFDYKAGYCQLGYFFGEIGIMLVWDFFEELGDRQMFLASKRMGDQRRSLVLQKRQMKEFAKNLLPTTSSKILLNILKDSRNEFLNIEVAPKVIFAKLDIAHFTNYCDVHSGAQIVKHLNMYFCNLDEILRLHGKTIKVKNEGDAFLCFRYAGRDKCGTVIQEEYVHDFLKMVVMMMSEVEEISTREKIDIFWRAGVVIDRIVIAAFRTAIVRFDVYGQAVMRAHEYEHRSQAKKILACDTTKMVCENAKGFTFEKVDDHSFYIENSVHSDVSNTSSERSNHNDLQIVSLQRGRAISNGARSSLISNGAKSLSRRRSWGSNHSTPVKKSRKELFCGALKYVLSFTWASTFLIALQHMRETYNTIGNKRSKLTKKRVENYLYNYVVFQAKNSFWRIVSLTFVYAAFEILILLIINVYMTPAKFLEILQPTQISYFVVLIVLFLLNLVLGLVFVVWNYFKDKILSERNLKLLQVSRKQRSKIRIRGLPFVTCIINVLFPLLQHFIFVAFLMVFSYLGDWFRGNGEKSIHIFFEIGLFVNAWFITLSSHPGFIFNEFALMFSLVFLLPDYVYYYITSRGLEAMLIVFGLLAVFFVFFYLKGNYNVSKKLSFFQVSQQIERLRRSLRRIKGKNKTLLRNLIPGYIANFVEDQLNERIHYFPIKCCVAFIQVTPLTESLLNDGYVNRSSASKPLRALKSMVLAIEALNRVIPSVRSIKQYGDRHIIISSIGEENEKEFRNFFRFICQIGDDIRSLFSTSKDQEAKSVQIGVARGKIHGGIIGTRNITFDIFGRSCNLACRMMELSEDNQVTVAIEDFTEVIDRKEGIPAMEILRDQLERQGFMENIEKDVEVKGFAEHKVVWRLRKIPIDHSS